MSNQNAPDRIWIRGPWTPGMAERAATPPKDGETDVTPYRCEHPTPPDIDVDRALRLYAEGLILNQKYLAALVNSHEHQAQRIADQQQREVRLREALNRAVWRLDSQHTPKAVADELARALADTKEPT